jgi:murein DD-endopeptidase MepM/ murein hydrolase activator NlpD
MLSRMAAHRKTILLIALSGMLVWMISASAMAAESPSEKTLPRFILPFEGPPGPDTWYFLQPYGNTAFAYQFRYSTYDAGQGLHFGVDLAAPCGTPIVAIGNGVVDSVDSWHGARPHNLMIDHQNGYMSFYGHLLVRAKLKPGQEVKAGEVIALSGDPDLTCSSRPHIHLEIRSTDHRTAYNPLLFIDVDWERLALIGGFPLRFEQDMDDPHRWQDLYDQPDTRFGYPLLNDYGSPWPPAR